MTLPHSVSASDTADVVTVHSTSTWGRHALCSQLQLFHTNVYASSSAVHIVVTAVKSTTNISGNMRAFYWHVIYLNKRSPSFKSSVSSLCLSFSFSHDYGQTPWTNCHDLLQECFLFQFQAMYVYSFFHMHFNPLNKLKWRPHHLCQYQLFPKPIRSFNRNLNWKTNT